MEKEQVYESITRTGVVAVIRGETKEEALRVARASVAGGIEAVEITFTVPGAEEVIRVLSDELAGKAAVGAGSVLDAETARIAILAGAQFIVSPCLSEEVIRTCNRYRVFCACGIMTVTEAVRAMEAGADLLKIFPADTLGMGFLKALHGPLPQAKLMPTGGVTVENTADWLRAGAVAVGTGGSLTKGDVSENARRFLAESAKALRG